MQKENQVREKIAAENTERASNCETHRGVVGWGMRKKLSLERDHEKVDDARKQKSKRRKVSSVRIPLNYEEWIMRT